MAFYFPLKQISARASHPNSETAKQTRQRMYDLGLVGCKKTYRSLFALISGIGGIFFLIRKTLNRQDRFGIIASKRRCNIGIQPV